MLRCCAPAAPFEAAQVLARPGAQQGSLDAERHAAVSGAGVAEARDGGQGTFETVVVLGVPLAVAAAGGALVLQRLTQGIAFAADGGEFVAARLASLRRAGIAVSALARPVVVFEQHLGDSLAAAEVVSYLLAVFVHDPVDDVDQFLFEVQGEVNHLRYVSVISGLKCPSS